MKSCRLVLSTLLLILLVGTAMAQDSTVTFTKYRILLKKGGHEVGTNGVLRGGEFSGTASDGVTSKHDVSEIARMDRLAGNNGGKGALIGGGIGALTAISAIIQVESDPNMELREDRVLPVTGVLVGGGALIGFLVGAGSERWERVDLRKVIGLKVHRGLSVQLAIRF